MEGPLWVWITRGFEGLCSLIYDLSMSSTGAAPDAALEWLQKARDWIDATVAREKKKRADGRPQT